MKRLELTFAMENKSNLILNLYYPRKGLTLETVRAEAAKMIPLLITRDGYGATALIHAAIVDTDRRQLV